MGGHVCPFVLGILRLVACLVLAGCGGGPSHDDVIAQAGDGDRIAFDIVKIDDDGAADAVGPAATRVRPSLQDAATAPELKIAVGDTVSVVIWESAANGLFGNSLTELTLPASATARLSTEAFDDVAAVGGAAAGLDHDARPLRLFLFGDQRRIWAASAALNPDLSAALAAEAPRRGAESAPAKRRSALPAASRSRGLGGAAGGAAWRPLPRLRFRPVAGGSGGWFPG